VALARRRSARFAKRWSLALGSLIVVAMVVPLATQDPRAADRSRLARLAADTLRSARRARLATETLTRAESLWADALRRPAPGARQVAAARPPTGTRPTAGLTAAIDEARRLRTVSAWLLVAERPEVSAGPRMRSLADTLRALAARREALPSGPERDRQLSELTQRMGRTGYTILAIAENRRLELDAGVDTSAAAASVALRGSRAVVEPEVHPDTAGIGLMLRAARDSATRARLEHDSLRMLLRAIDSSIAAVPPSGIPASSPAIVLAVILVGGLVLRFGASLSREIRAPALANAREVEALAGVPVLATVRDALLDGPARYRPSGVDPFRMLYLGLTATGTRTRTAVVTGRDGEIAAAAGARLAIAAAADHRTTLVIDVDPTRIALARVLRERAEPGLSDALAGAFRWREVARPIGSSDGLPITLLPAGTEREDLAVGEALDRLLEEFARFRAGFELTILVAPRERLELAERLVGKGPLLLATISGETSVEAFAAECTALRDDGRRPHGVVLWDTTRPVLPSRAELAALVSKRKGRTPGGSFEAVRRVIRNRDPRA
jgi:Mrp family chromosome partitioning ATPase